MVPQPRPCHTPVVTKIVVNHSGREMKVTASPPSLVMRLLMGPLVDRISRTMPATMTIEMKWGR